MALTLHPNLRSAFDFIASGDPIEDACVKAHVAKDELLAQIQDKRVQEFIARLSIQKSKASMVNEDRIKALMHDGLERVEKEVGKGSKLTRDDVSLLSLAAEVTGMKKQKLDVTIRPANPYEKMEPAEKARLIKESLEWAQANLNDDNEPNPSAA